MTKAEEDLQKELRRLGCCVCRFIYHVDMDVGNVEEVTAIHHIVEGGKRLGEMYVLPLCDTHHQYGTKEHPSRHANGSVGGRAQFIKVHGVDEYDLLTLCEQYLDRPFSSENESSDKGVFIA